ncbi:hypothetical protein QA612_08750 [Evansella sp. AB-P1]|uniref:hypothetical protein n=1 Tax=Evansella sp. AB-P1 TaxID=3037653 RepID=UPI00241BFD47|nr:hypothetical protein [Evansella sp. AB-P1]MDG5787583.1 hypothetical protein [Evansella sp. AB-P1]
MKLVQVLLNQPQKELVDRVNELHISCNSRSRQELTEQLTKVLLNKVRLKEEWTSLLNTEQHLLLQMCYHSTIQFITSDELKICLKQDDRKDFDQIIRKLRKKGWIYQDTSGFWILPLELKEWIHEHNYEEWCEDFIYIPKQQDRNFQVVNDVFTFLDIVEEKKVSLTKMKTIYKKELLTILSQLSVEESPPQEQWRFGYGRHFNSYPDCFSFLYDFCFDQGWIVEGEALMIGPNWEKGQRISVNELMDRMLRAYIKLYRRAIPQLPFLLEMLRMVLVKGEAIEKKQLISRIKQYVDPYYYDKPTDIIHLRIIKILTYIHFLSSKMVDNCEYVYLHPRMINKM